MPAERSWEIEGRPTEEETAAILAAVAEVLAAQRAAAAKPPPRPTVSAWVQAGKGPRMEGTPPGVDPAAPPA